MSPTSVYGTISVDLLDKPGYTLWALTFSVEGSISISLTEKGCTYRIDPQMDCATKRFTGAFGK